ncbi:hypothetical protein ABZ401_32200 [Streptomyces sp. NPDC005892]|uniref:hypothetical protein n=1 Tax=Streptomyces sp. NPDC005892 TaxID=3155593 RepID=UPI003404242C
MNREIKRRSDAVQVSPNTHAVARPAGHRRLGRTPRRVDRLPRRYLSVESMDSLYPDSTTPLPGTTG